MIIDERLVVEIDNFWKIVFQLNSKSKGAVAMDNKLQKTGQNSLIDNFVKTDDILNDMCGIIESSQKAAYQAVNTTLIQRNWLLGYRIAGQRP